jgi:hypothetical protein
VGVLWIRSIIKVDFGIKVEFFPLFQQGVREREETRRLETGQGPLTQSNARGVH